MIRLAVALLVVLSSVVSIALSASAQSETRVTVRVLDQSSKRGLVLARVLLSGPLQKLGYTDDTGSVSFDDVQAGLYRLTIVKSGYQIGTARFQARAGESVSVDVGLASMSALKTIGSVSVRSASSSGVSDYSRNGAVRKTNDSLPDALRFDPNAFVGADGSVSINGQPPSSTAYTLDGIPLGGGGSGFDARRINGDLFSSVSVSQDPANGGTGGSVDLRSYEPTIDFQMALSGRYASNDDSSFSSVLTGSAANLGYVLSAAGQGHNGALAGQRFLDTSGLDYVHGDGSFTNGLLAKLRLGLSASQSVSLTAMRTKTLSDQTCDAFGALLPCGYGPGNTTASSLRLAGLTYTGVFDRLQLLAVPFVRSERYDQDLRNRISYGAPDPAGASVSALTAGARLSATFDATSATQYELSTSLQRTRLSSNAFALGSSATTDLDRLFEDTALTARVRLSRALSLRPGVRYTRADAQAHATADLGAVWSPTRADTYALNYSPRRFGVSSAFRGALASPASLQLDCAGRDALATGGGDPASDPTSSQARTTWTHQHRNTRTIVTAYRTHLLDALIPGYVNAASLTPDAIPAGYLSSASGLYQSGAGCGAAQPLAFSDLLVQQPVRIASETLMGFSAAASTRIGRSLVVIPAYTATYARADALDARFLVPRSVVLTGAQLPGIPLHRWSLVADYRRPAGGPEAILTLQHVGENNPNHLPAYTLLGAGLSLPTAHGNLVLSAYNLANRFAAPFASAANAVPLATNAGRPFALLAYPLPARRITVAYSLTAGRAASTRAVATTSGLPAEADSNSVRRFDIGALPQTPPKFDDGLRTDPVAQSCVPEALRDARPIVTELRVYAAKLGEKGEGDRPSAPPPRIAGTTVSYHRTSGGYQLLFNFDRRATLAIGRCGHFAYADREDAQRLALGDRADLKSWQLDFRYEPRFGLFLVERDNIVTAARSTRPPLPASPPADPFAPKPGSDCKLSERSAVIALLKQLSPALAAGVASGNDLFAIAPHGSGDTRWYAVKLNDPLLVVPFLDCVSLATASRDELRQHGIDGEPLPIIQYAPRYGWYVLQ